MATLEQVTANEGGSKLADQLHVSWRVLHTSRKARENQFN